MLVFYGVLVAAPQLQQRYDDFHPDKAKDKKAARLSAQAYSSVSTSACVAGL